MSVPTPVVTSQPAPGVVEIVMGSAPVNSFSLDFLDALGQAVAAVPTGTAAVLLTSTVEGFFAAGGDLAYMAAADPRESDAYVALVQQVYAEFERPDFVSVAAVSGFCLGGGLELALACDIRMVTQAAVLGLPEVTLGILAGGGAIHRLVRAVGQGVARDMLLTGQRISGEEAHRWGLASRLVEGDVAAAARELGQVLATGSPEAVSATKTLAISASSDELGAGLSDERQAWSQVRAGANAQEGLSAFVDKRPPRFLRAPA